MVSAVVGVKITTPETDIARGNFSGIAVYIMTGIWITVSVIVI
jgi:hypothetical protein